MHGPRREEKQTAMNQIISYSNFWNYIDLELSNLMSSYFIARKLKVKKISLVTTKKHKQRKKNQNTQKRNINIYSNVNKLFNKNNKKCLSHCVPKINPTRKKFYPRNKLNFLIELS